MFSKILIANRGEVAVRIIRACKEMGILTVAVYSDADKDSLHSHLADESYCIGEADAQDSYLNQEKIINAAILSGSKAIHPGYGFLSENADFAKLCKENNLIFIGPDVETMEKFSNKSTLKELISKTKLNVITGTKPIDTIEEAKKQAKKIGYPVMIKSCSGGGGRGIRLVESEENLKENFLQATSEADSAFGDASVYIEKYVHPARHIEIQIIADLFGNVVCLGERDCSIQERNQKLIEESPSPFISEKQRKKIIELCIDAMKKLEYQGAGTLEFLVDNKGNFWFMEMNVRLQVEHCVTEMLTNIDIVKWQIRVAAGIPIDFTQDDIKFFGSSIECRVNALGCGRLDMIHAPGGPGVRFDTGLVTGASISPYYDSLLGKVIVYGINRDEAIRKMRASLCELFISGIETNIEKQLDILDEEIFIKGEYDLTFMENRSKRTTV